MAKSYKRYSREFRLGVVQEIRQGQISLRAVARKYNLSSSSVMHWLEEYDKDPQNAFLRKSRLATNGDLRLNSRIDELERMVGRLTMENDFLKKVIEKLESLKEPELLQDTPSSGVDEKRSMQ
jgi:transposase